MPAVERALVRAVGSCGHGCYPRWPSAPGPEALQPIRHLRSTLMSLIHRAAAAAVAAGMTAAAGLAIAPAASATTHQPSFIGQFHQLATIGSTVPRNGDVNPYGMVAIRHNRGKLRRGHVLISNFNNKANLQGTGTTIVEISPRGHRTRRSEEHTSELQ